MQSARLVWADGEPLDVGRDMRSGGVTGIHPTRQGHLYISANTPRFWSALCRLVGLPELAEDPRYDTVRKRAQQAAELVVQLHEALAQRTALEWEALFGDEVPCAASRRIEEMFEHPQVQAEGMIATMPHPVLGQLPGPDPRDQVRPHAGARALRRADARPACGGTGGRIGPGPG